MIVSNFHCLPEGNNSRREVIILDDSFRNISSVSLRCEMCLGSQVNENIVMLWDLRNWVCGKEGGEEMYGEFFVDELQWKSWWIYKNTMQKEEFKACPT